MENNILELDGIFKNGYGFIAKSAMQDNQLSLQAKGLYAYLCSYSGKGKDVFPSRKKMCFDLNITNDTLGKYLKELKESNYIQITQSKNESRFSNNIYKINLNLPCTKISDTENSDTKNLDTNNNIINNNTINNNILINKKEKINKKEYGEFKNVLLTDKEYEYIKEIFPKDYLSRIQTLDDYIQSKGKKYKDFVATLKNWARRDGYKFPNEQLERKEINITTEEYYKQGEGKKYE